MPVKRALRVAWSAVATAVTWILIVFNARLHMPLPDHGAIGKQLSFIRERLERGDGTAMQQLFPEGYFFSHTFYGLAAIELGQVDDARWALARIESAEGRAPFSAKLVPAYGMFYIGWNSWLRGKILEHAPGDASAQQIFEAQCDQIAAAISVTAFPDSYPGQSWPCDSTVGVAALALHDRLFPPRYRTAIESWIDVAESTVDPQTGLLPHREPRDEGRRIARGTSQSIIQRFLPEIDRDFAVEQYAKFRKGLVATVAGVPGVREFPVGNAAEADVDSGPLLFGFSLSASATTIGAAIRNNDLAFARTLGGLCEAFGMPITFGNRTRYLFGQLVIADAMIAWAYSAAPNQSVAALPGNRPSFVALHGVSLLILLLFWLPLRRR